MHHALRQARMRGYTEQQSSQTFFLFPFSAEEAHVMEEMFWGPGTEGCPRAAHTCVLLSRAPPCGPVTAPKLLRCQPHRQGPNPTALAPAAISVVPKLTSAGVGTRNSA